MSTKLTRRFARSVRATALGAAAVAALAVHAQPAAAERSPRVPLTVEVTELARVPADVMRDAKAEVDDAFLAAGVRIVWARPAEATRQGIRRLRLFVVRTSPTAPRSRSKSRSDVLGLSPTSGDWAYVFYDRVAEAVARSRGSISVVLAHVMSHELGHLLLPPESHAPLGIMRPTVDPDHGTWCRFTGHQARFIRAAVTSGASPRTWP